MTANDMERVIELGRVIHVKKYVRNEWKRKYETFKPRKIDNDFEREVQMIWGKVKPDLRQVAWYNNINEVTPPLILLSI